MFSVLRDTRPPRGYSSKVTHRLLESSVLFVSHFLTRNPFGWCTARYGHWIFVFSVLLFFFVHWGVRGGGRVDLALAVRRREILSRFLSRLVETPAGLVWTNARRWGGGSKNVCCHGKTQRLWEPKKKKWVSENILLWYTLGKSDILFVFQGRHAVATCFSITARRQTGDPSQGYRYWMQRIQILMHSVKLITFSSFLFVCFSSRSARLIWSRSLEPPVHPYLSLKEWGPSSGVWVRQTQWKCY